MQALLWNFLKQGTTHKAGFEGLFDTCSEFLCVAFDDCKHCTFKQHLSLKLLKGCEPNSAGQTDEKDQNFYDDEMRMYLMLVGGLHLF